MCFPMGKGMYLAVHIPEDEVVLNSRENAPYLICVEVLKSETLSSVKDGSSYQKFSRLAWMTLKFKSHHDGAPAQMNLLCNCVLDVNFILSIGTSIAFFPLIDN